jgi:hypothetical protein
LKHSNQEGNMRMARAKQRRKTEHSWTTHDKNEKDDHKLLCQSFLEEQTRKTKKNSETKIFGCRKTAESSQPFESTSENEHLARKTRISYLVFPFCSAFNDSSLAIFSSTIRLTLFWKSHIVSVRQIRPQNFHWQT